MKNKPYLYQNSCLLHKKAISVLLLVITAVGVYFYAYKGHRKITMEEAAFTNAAIVIKDSIVQNNAAFFNQTIEAFGIVTAVEENTLTINDALLAQFENSPNATINQPLRIKGRCIGYDDLFEVVVLDQSIILE